MTASPAIPEASQGSQTTRHASSAEALLASCTTCAKAKSKCVRRPGANVCERCVRLRRDCQIRERNVRRRNTVKATRTAQLKQLETKLEDIAHTLRAKHTQDLPPTSGSEISTSHATDDSRYADQSRQFAPGSEAQSVSTSEYSAAHSTPESSHYEVVGLSAQEIDVLFDRYRRLMAPNNPFVVLPTNTDASTLAKSESLLLQAITTVTFFHDTTRQQKMAKDLTREICGRLLVNGEKSIGILQALLVFLNWYNPHLFFMQNSTSLLHLSMALATNLNIDRGPTSDERALIEAAVKAYGLTQGTKTFSNDERRAVLGVFYLTSVTFTSFRKVDYFRWTPWLTECVNALSEAKEHESDAHLVQLVQMQRVMQEAMCTEYNAPVQFYAKSFLSELDGLALFPERCMMATILRSQKACTRTAIWQQSFAGLTNDTTKSSELRQRLDGMWHCMEAVKLHMDEYLEIPVEEYPLLPYSIFAQFAYVIGAFLRALTIDLHGWDLKVLHSYMDFPTLMRNTSRRHDGVSQARTDGLILKNNAFAQWAAKLRWAKNVYETRFMSADNGVQHGQLDDILATIPVAGLESSNQDMTMDTLFGSYANFHDFWDDFNDPLQTHDNLGLGLGNF